MRCEIEQKISQFAVVEHLRTIAGRDHRGPAEAATAWTLNHPAVTAAIVGAARDSCRPSALHCCLLGARYRQNGHDLDGIAREDHKVRMLFEELGGSLVRIRANDRVGAQLIACVFDAARRYLFGLP